MTLDEMNVLLNCHDTHSWTTEINRVDLLYHLFIHSPPPIQSEICNQSWQLELVLSFISILLWSSVAAVVGYIAVTQIDRERIQEVGRQQRDRLFYILKVIKVKVSNNEKNSLCILQTSKIVWLILLPLDRPFSVFFCMKQHLERQPATSEVLFTKVDLSDNDTKHWSKEVDSAGAMEGPTLPLSSSDTCCICLEDFRLGEQLCQSYNCSHVFHLGCMLEWLMGHDECPVCRRDYLSHPIEEGGSQRVCQTVLYVDPVSPSLLPPTSYVEERLLHNQITNNRIDATGLRIQRRRSSEGFAASSLFGFDDFPPWLSCPWRRDDANLAKNTLDSTTIGFELELAKFC